MHLKTISSIDSIIELTKPIIYGDIFDHALTFEEVHKYTSIKISKSDLQQALFHSEHIKSIIGMKKNLFCLKGREHICDAREAKTKNAKILFKKAKKIVSFLQYIPFVRGILITGSLANSSIKNVGDDIDYLIIVQHKRIWIVFLIFGALQRLVSRKLFCSNFYVSTEYLAIPEDERDYFTAREVFQAQPIYGKRYCMDFKQINLWAHNFFPHYNINHSGEENINAQHPVGELLKGFIEKLLSGSRGDKIESLLKKILIRRLTHHFKQSGLHVPDKIYNEAWHDIRLRFHGLGHREFITNELDKKIIKFRKLLKNEN